MVVFNKMQYDTDISVMYLYIHFIFNISTFFPPPQLSLSRHFIQCTCDVFPCFFFICIHEACPNTTEFNEYY